MILIVLLISLVLLIVFSKKYFNRNSLYWEKKGVTYVYYSEVATRLERWLVKVPLHEADERVYQKLKVSKVRYGGGFEFSRPIFYPMDLELWKAIMVKDFDFFVNRRIFEGQKSDKYFKDMLALKENQEWKDLRSTMSPTFTTGKIRRMFEVFNHCGDKLVNFINLSIKDSNEVELRDIGGKFTLDVIASASFGVDGKIFESSNSVFHAMAKRFQTNFSGVLGTLKIVMMLAAPKLLKLMNISISDIKSSEFFSDIIRNTINHRQSTGEKREDFLQIMLEAKTEKLTVQEPEDEISDFEKDAKLSPDKVQKIKITDEIVTAQCILFFVAGFDTAETFLIFFAYEMALNPDIQEKLAREIDEATKDNDGKLTYDMANHLEYLDKVVSETLRKWPPGVRAERIATKDYKVPDSDFVLPKDTLVALPIWAIHRDPEYYPDPEKFDPERFSPANKAKRHPYSYLPFGAGPRNCIAMRFALMQAKTAAAKLVQNFIFEPCSKTHIPMKFVRSGIMKPEGGMWFNIKSRNATTIEE